jgi:hypothetical protein
MAIPAKVSSKLAGIMRTARTPFTKRESLVRAASDELAPTHPQTKKSPALGKHGEQHVIECRLPAAWDHPEGFSATSMGPPGCQ